MRKRNLYFVSFLLIFLFNCIELQAKDEIPEGWNKWVNSQYSPSAYEAGIDTKVFHSPPKSYYIKFNELTEIKTSSRPTASIHQSLLIKDFLGKRIKLSAFLKGNNLTGKAAFYIHIHSVKDGREEYLRRGADDIRGSTDWKLCTIIIDVEENASSFIYGLFIEGQGQVWVDDVNIEIVGKEIPEKGVWFPEKGKPYNLCVIHACR